LAAIKYSSIGAPGNNSQEVKLLLQAFPQNNCCVKIAANRLYILECCARECLIGKLVQSFINTILYVASIEDAIYVNIFYALINDAIRTFVSTHFRNIHLYSVGGISPRLTINCP